MTGPQPPLAGIRVLDVANYISGPFAAMALGDLGADVLKVEPPRGDAMRTFGARRRGTSVLWAGVNRNKRSLVLDLKTSEDRARFLELAGEADALVANWRPGVAESLGIGDDVIEAANPRLVRCYVTGFGPTGPLAQRPAYDGLLQAIAGVASIQGGEGPPVMMETMLVDKVTAMTAAQSILAALVGRARTGRGGRIDLSMLDAIAWFLFPDSMQAHAFEPDDGEVPPDSGNLRSPILATADGYMLVAPVSGAQIGRMCEALSHPEWKAELKAIRDPGGLAAAMFDRAEAVTRTGTTAHWVEVLVAADVPVAPVLDREAFLRFEQAVHNGTFAWMDGTTLGRQRGVRQAARFAGVELPLRPPPALGERGSKGWDDR